MDILKPILLGELLDEAHIEALSKITGKDAATFLLAEPCMRDFGIAISPVPSSTEQENVKREAFAVSVCIKDADGGRPITPELYLDKLKGSTGYQLSAIAEAWLLEVHKEGNRGLGKRLAKVGLREDTPSVSSKPPQEEQSNSS